MPHIFCRCRGHNGHAIRDSNAIYSDSRRNGCNGSTFRDGNIRLQRDFIPCEPIGVATLQIKNPGCNGHNAALIAWDRHYVERNRAVQSNVNVAGSEIFCHGIHPIQFTKPLPPQPQPTVWPPQVKIGVRPYTGVVGTGQEFRRLYRASTSLAKPCWIRAF